jgi:hypothetical protein
MALFMLLPQRSLEAQSKTMTNAATHTAAFSKPKTESEISHTRARSAAFRAVTLLHTRPMAYP